MRKPRLAILLALLFSFVLHLLILARCSVPVPSRVPADPALPLELQIRRVVLSPQASSPTKSTLHNKARERTQPARTPSHSVPPVHVDEVSVATPHFNLGAAIEAARQDARAHAPPAKMMPEKQQETPLAQAISKSERPDCRRAYAPLGLLALPLLLKDSVKDEGCQW